MAISYVGGKGAGSAGQGGGSIAINSGLTGGSGSAAAAGDLVVVTVSVGAGGGRNPSTAIATPSGYTALTQQFVSATYSISVQTCYKIMGSTPDTSVTIPPSGNDSDPIAYTIQVFRGVASTAPMDATPTYASGTATLAQPDPAAITPVSTGAWIVVCGAQATAGTPGALLAAYLTNVLNPVGNDVNDTSLASGYYTAWVSGAYDPARFTGGTSAAGSSWGATTLALRPSVSVSTNVTGVSGTGAVGTVTVAAKASTTATGVSATGATGTVTVIAGATVAGTGNEATGQVGDVTVSLPAVVLVTGVGAMGEIGDVLVSQSDQAAVTGVEATGGVGDVAVSLTGVTVFLTGVFGTGYVGTVLVWGLAGDTQTPAWQNVANSDAPAWSAIPTTDSGAWQPDTTTGAPTWTGVPNAQTAAWDDVIT